MPLMLHTRATESLQAEYVSCTRLLTCAVNNTSVKACAYTLLSASTQSIELLQLGGHWRAKNLFKLNAYVLLVRVVGPW